MLKQFFIHGKILFTFLKMMVYTLISIRWFMLESLYNYILYMSQIDELRRTQLNSIKVKNK